MSHETRKIGSYILFAQDKDEKRMAGESVIQVIKSIKAMPLKKRKFENSENNCFFYLSNLQDSPLYPHTTHLIFKTAKYNHRPALVDHKTMKERDNPKSLSEGEGEKTHLSFKLDFEKNELICLLEERKMGLSMKQICSYLEFHADQNKNKEKVFFCYDLVAGNDFIIELKRMDNVKTCEIEVDTEYLGSAFAKMAKRAEVRPYAKIILKAKRRGNIKNSSLDGFKMFKGEKIKRIRIIGNRNQEKGITLDTEFIQEIRRIAVDLEPDTHVVHSSDILRKFENILNEE